MESKSKNILYVSTRLPYPLIGGDRVHIYNYLGELKKRGHNITLITLVSNDDDLDGALKDGSFFTKLIPIKFNKKIAYLNAAKALFNNKPFIVQYFYSAEMQKAVDKEIDTGDYDLLIGYIIRSLPYIIKHKKIKKLIHLCDAVSMVYKRRAKVSRSLWEKFKIGIEYLKVINYEKLACKNSDCQILISKTDADYLKSFVTGKNIKVIGFATDSSYFAPQNVKKKNAVCFVGTMQYIPNFEAVKYFVLEVFPLIKKQIPDAEFKIVGANPQKELYEIAKKQEGVEVTGKVDDVREYMKDCKVSVCPVRIAGGVQTKILEAMSMGLAVVTTPEGAEGIGAPGDILTVAQNKEDFASKVAELFNNEDLRNEIAVKSREFILDNYSWNEVGDKWDKAVRAL